MIDRDIRQDAGRDAAQEWVLSTEERLPWLRGYLGNGRLAIQLVAEGGLAGTHGAPLHLMAQLYDRPADHEVEHPAPLPTWSGLHLAVGEHVLRSGDALAYRQTVDLRHGLAITRHCWQIEGKRLEAVITQAVLRHEPNLSLIAATLTGEEQTEIAITAAFTLPAIMALRDPTTGVTDGHLLFQAHTLQRGIPVAIAGALVTDGVEARVEGAELVLTLALEPGRARTVYWLVAAHSAYSASDPRAAALADLRRGLAAGPASLLTDHGAAWERLWRADVVVEGAEDVQRFIRAGLFWLRCSLRDDVPASIAPMGLSSLGYNGHIFWDADTWMYPGLLMLDPDLAQGILTYRQDRLPAAHARAVAEGYQGAMYPWESATDGVEQTPSWANTGRKEHHITACVALAQWQYYLATGDRAWLAERAWPVLEGAARFWASRVVPGRNGGYEIHDVICADEYAEDVDNNAFTNAAARAALLAAVAAARDLGLDAPPEWRAVAEGLVLPWDGDLVLEFDGYSGQVIKQADVELLTYPLEHPLPARTILRNLDTYRSVTDPEGPAMGKSISSIVAAQLGRRDEALALFRGSYEPNLYGPFHALAETPSNGALVFLTGVGGALQALLFGFGGLRLHEGAFGVDPLLPSGWRAIRFPCMRWRGREFSLAVLPGDRAAIGFTHAGVEVGLILQRWRAGDEPLTVELRGGEGMECFLKAEDWRVEPQYGVTLTWRVWPPTGGPVKPFVRLHLTARTEQGTPMVLEIDQRVADGDVL